MRFLNKIKMGTKLLILIATMLIGIVLVGGIGYYYNTQSQKALDNMYKQNLVSIELLTDVRTQSRANFANVLKLILITDSSEQKETKADIEKRTAAIDKDFKEYETLDFDTYEIQQYEVVKKQLSAWNTMLNKFVELSTSGKSKEALDLFKSSGEKMFEDLQTAIRDLLNDNIKDADELYQKNLAEAKVATTLLIVVIVVTALVCILLGRVIVKSITTPITKLVGFIRKTAELDFVYDASFDVLLIQKDEIGVMAQAVADMRKALRQMAGKVITISNNLAASSEQLTASTDENTNTVNQVVVAINEIADGNGSLAETVNKASETMNEVARNIDVVNKATSQSVGNAKNSLEIVVEGQKAVDVTIGKMQENIKVSTEVNDSIHQLSELMVQVNTITDVINSIATQTNLLALNAAIEAARAGEAGKGFAVVAEEIRKLAEGSSSAAQQITNIIKDTVEKNAVTTHNMEKAQQILAEQEKAVKVTKEVFDRIKESVDDIANQTKNAAMMLNTIDTASKEVSNQTQDMAAIAQQSAASSQQISASSQEQLASIEMIAKAANDLSTMALELNNEINQFKI
jgi:methyl-accepting chemotaxis protein